MSIDTTISAQAQPTVLPQQGQLRRSPALGQRPVEELRALAMQGSSRFREGRAEDVIEWAADDFGPKLAVACSMAEALLPHMVGQVLPGVEVVFLDTGYHFAETLATRDEVVKRLPVTVVNVEPRRTVPEQDAEFGEQMHSWDPVACCEMRKVVPLKQALSGYEAWASGLRREDSARRATTPIVEWDRKNALVKINPIAAWTQAEVDAYIAKYDIPVNPLLSQGYPSIGCAPCTAKVLQGQDARSGRWAGTNKNECGIHI